ncbi:hypothetical protein [Candidatus Odyssella thessalonicensis]|uniref:hypothetical protein n=1 Tax=Candidatus Odyssella thessalonicensis TaxID=84647 RepID=UPI000225B77B|nr:hypothetical protein [Candidatus Odyssella thessalonicensis]
MSNNSFNKPPLSPSEKEKKAEAFIGFLDTSPMPVKRQSSERVLEKEKTKSFVLRVPESLYMDLKEIAALTSISINSICLELLRPSIKKKLKELKDIE